MPDAAPARHQQDAGRGIRAQPLGSREGPALLRARSEEPAAASSTPRSRAIRSRPRSRPCCATRSCPARATSNGLVQLGTGALDGDGGIPDPPVVIFAPRGGFAWSPTESTVLRGGFGWAYNRENIAAASTASRTCSASRCSSRRPAWPRCRRRRRPPDHARSRRRARRSRTNKKPTTYDYSLSLQQQFLKDFVLDVAYIGNVQKNQPVEFNINAIPLGTAFDPEVHRPEQRRLELLRPGLRHQPGRAAGQQHRQQPAHAAVPGLRHPHAGRQPGHGALQRPAGRPAQASAKGLAFQISYTLGRTTGDVETPGLYLDDWQAYGGYKLGSDRLHVLNVNYTYEAPKLADKLKLDNVVGPRVPERLARGRHLSLVQRPGLLAGLQHPAGEHHDERGHQQGSAGHARLGAARRSCPAIRTASIATSPTSSTRAARRAGNLPGRRRHRRAQLRHRAAAASRTTSRS